MLQRCFAQSLLVLVVSGVRDTSPAFKGHVNDFADTGNFSLSRLDHGGNTSVAPGLCEPKSVSRDEYYCLSLAFPLPVFPCIKIEGALRIRFLSDVQNCFQFVVTGSVGIRVLFFAAQFEFEYTMAQEPRFSDAPCSDVVPTKSIVMSFVATRLLQWAKGEDSGVKQSRLAENSDKIRAQLYNLKREWKAKSPDELYQTPFNMNTLGVSLDWIYIQTKREFQALRAKLSGAPTSIPDAFGLLMKAYEKAKGRTKAWPSGFATAGMKAVQTEVQSCFDLDTDMFSIKEWMWCYFTQMYDFSKASYRELVSELCLDMHGPEHLRLWKNVNDHSHGLIVEASADICDHDTDNCLVTFPRDFLALYPCTSHFLITYMVFSDEDYKGGVALELIWSAMQQQWGDMFDWAQVGEISEEEEAHDVCAGLNSAACYSKPNECYWKWNNNWKTSCIAIAALDCTGLPSDPCQSSPSCTWKWSGNWESSCVSICKGQPRRTCGDGCEWKFKGDWKTACIDKMSACEGRPRRNCGDGCVWTDSMNWQTACQDVKGKKFKKMRNPYDRFPDLSEMHDRLIYNNVVSKVTESGGSLYKSFWTAPPAWERYMGAYSVFLKRSVMPEPQGQKRGYGGEIGPRFNLKDTFAISLTVTSGNLFTASTSFCSAPYMEFRIQHVWNLNSLTNEKTCISGRAWIAPIKQNKIEGGQLWMFRFDPKWCYDYELQESEFKFPIGLRQGAYSCSQSFFERIMVGNPENFICLDVEHLAFRLVNDVLRDLASKLAPPSLEAGGRETASSIEDKAESFVNVLTASITAAITIMAKNSLLNWGASVLSAATESLTSLMPAELVAECLHYSQQIVELTDVWSKGVGAIQDPSVGWYDELQLSVSGVTVKTLYQFEAKYGRR